MAARTGARRVGARAPGRAPNLKLELSWLAEGHAVVAGSDEVGRGPLAGPVSAGVVLVDAGTGRQPNGLRDSKLLTPQQRERLVPRIRDWALAWGVGHASAQEIDAIGILRALRLAGERALAALPAEPDVVLLDGNYDWFTRPARSHTSPRAAAPSRVELLVKADLVSSSVAAASVLAKVERDRIMTAMAQCHPGYGWHSNKGYSTPDHYAALRALGPCEEHRRTWNLTPCEQLELAELLDAAV